MLALAISDFNKDIDNQQTDTEQPEQKTIFDIPTINLDLLKAKLEKFNRRCNKLGFTPFVVTIHNTFHQKANVLTNDGTITTNHPIEFSQISITGESPLIDGWSFVASCELLESGIIIKSIPGKTDIIPERYRNKIGCDHCQSNRQRKYGYIIKNELGHSMQVGKGCLKDFFGNINPNAIAEYLEWLYSPDLSEYASITSDNVNRAVMYDITEYLQQVNACIREQTFFISKSNYDKGQPTADYAHDCINPLMIQHMKKYKIPIPEVKPLDTETALNALQWAKELIPDNDYLQNIKVFANEKYIKTKHMGYVASIIPAYQKAIGKIKQVEIINQEKAQSQYVGEVKSKIQIELEYINSFKSEFSYSAYNSTTTFIHKFKDINGNIFTWSTAKSILEIINGDKYWTKEAIQEYESGNKLILKGTIKNHAEYKCEKQTVLTRCKLV